jgi:hypothetical protein
LKEVRAMNHIPDKPPFEIPPELRDLAKRNVEQARAAYGQFMDLLTQAMDASSMASPIPPGFRAVQDLAIKFAKENAGSLLALASELAGAEDIQEVLTLQTSYAQTQMQAYALQAQELGRLMAKAMPTLSRTMAIS